MVKILIVDDSNFERMVSVKLFGEYEDFEIDEAINYEQTIERFKAEKYDVVVLDILMEGKDGIEILADLRHIRSDFKVILLSSLSEDELKPLAMENKADAYIVKPVSSMKVMDALEALGYS